MAKGRKRDFFLPFFIGRREARYVQAAIDGGNLNGAYAVNETVSILKPLHLLVNNPAFASSRVA